MSLAALIGAALANAILGSASPIASRAVQRGNHDLASILASAADDPSVNDGWLFDTAAALVNGITYGSRSEDRSMEDAYNAIQVTVEGANSPLDAAVRLTNPAFTGTGIYPSRKEGKDDLRAASYIPKSFKYAKDGKKPVILVPGTAIPAGGRQSTSEYIAYAINYISAATNTNVAVIAWPQGNLNTQWSFKYRPWTRDVVDDFIATSSDPRGTVIADSICSLLSGVFCTPLIFQLRWEKEFINPL
ncbi:hypothetical protein BDV12DRAFT_199208 [Aspergillus spectabilis]